MINHFILTRFNITLWQKDKNGKSIDRERWLEKRLELFETYCLPSVMGQTCQDFVWVLLVDADTPEKFRKRIKGYRDKCPQIKYISVKSQYGFQFAYVFKDVVNRLLREKGAKDGDLCLTTYFDNDDVLDSKYVEKVQKLSEAKPSYDVFFIVYDYGYQYFTQIGVTTRIKYPNNHFMTLVERLDPVTDDTSQNSKLSNLSLVKTCYGYGSHFMIEANNVAKVVHVNDKDHPMWTEVIHEANVDNDVKMTFDTKIMSEGLTVMGFFKFGVRAIKQVVRRGKDKIIPRRWE